jgi:N-formylglutamate deformylase
MDGYLAEPEPPLGPDNWPPPLDDVRAARLRVALRDILQACIAFANSRRSSA